MSRKVLITRHPSDCRQLQELLRPSGVILRPFPVLRIDRFEDHTGWRRLEEASLGSAWLAMASPRAPQPWVDQARTRAARHLSKLPVAVVEALKPRSPKASLCSGSMAWITA